MKFSGSELDPGQQILAFMRPQVEAYEDFYLRWQEVEQANPDKDAYIAAGLSIEEVYSGVDALREDEILALQAMAAQNEIMMAEFGLWIYFKPLKVAWLRPGKKGGKRSMAKLLKVF